MSEEIKSITEDDLVSELWARDVQFLMRQQLHTPKPMLSQENLIKSLAESENARLRYSLIPLFLRHPEFSVYVEKIDKIISSSKSQLILRFYYSAAVLLQKKHQEQLIEIFNEQPELPNIFSEELDIQENTNFDLALSQLAEKHKALSGQFVNWLETYKHAADVWLKQMELQKT